VHLVRCGHFGLRDKDGGHTIRFIIAENPMLQANIMSPSSTEPATTQFYIAEARNFVLFCSCDLDPMTFIYELDAHSLKMYAQTKMNFLCQGFRKLLYYRQTDIDICTDHHHQLTFME